MKITNLDAVAPIATLFATDGKVKVRLEGAIGRKHLRLSDVVVVDIDVDGKATNGLHELDVETGELTKLPNEPGVLVKRQSPSKQTDGCSLGQLTEERRLRQLLKK